MKRLAIIFNLILILFIGSVAQPDTTSAIEESSMLFMDTSSYQKLFKPIDKVVYSYGKEENVQIIYKNDKYYKLYYDSSNIKICQNEVSFKLYENTHVIAGLLEKDSIPKYRITYEILLVPNGEHIEWYKNGKVKSQGQYYWSHKDKIWKYYSENGILIKEEKWKKGILK